MQPIPSPSLPVAAPHDESWGARVRRGLRPPRRLHLHRAGWVFVIGSIALGLAAIATGNNLLFLILGAMLGMIALSGWMSEQVLRGVEVTRRIPAGVTAGEPVRLVVEVANRKRWLPTLALEVGEVGREARGFVAVVEPGEVGSARAEERWERRGVFPLEGVTLATSFPFGLFRKERDIDLPGSVVVWPRTDRAVREVRPSGEAVRRSGAAAAQAAGARGEFRSLRDLRPGDDSRDIHWKSSARRVQPVIREFHRDESATAWICLDLRAGEEEGEAQVEVAAALAARAAARGEPFALVTPDVEVAPGAGAGQLERVLDTLAAARFRADAPPPEPPVDRAGCVLVSATARGWSGWGDVVTPTEGEG